MKAGRTVVDVGAPDLVAFREVPGRVDDLDSQDGHQALDKLAVDHIPFQSQPVARHSASPGRFFDIEPVSWLGR